MAEPLNHLINRQRKQIACLKDKNTALQQAFNDAKAESALRKQEIERLQVLLATKSKTPWMDRLRGLVRG